MAKAKNPASPDPEETDQDSVEGLIEDIADDAGDASEEDGEDNFDKILAHIMNPTASRFGRGNGQPDMAAILALEEKREARRAAAEARREAQAEKQFMMKMLIMLTQPKATDPLLLQLIGSLTNNKQHEEFTRNMLEMQRNNSQVQIESMRDVFSKAQEMKDELTRDMIEQARESKDTHIDNPALQIFREIKDLAAPIIAAKVGTKPTGENPPAVTAAPPSMSAKTDKERIPLFLRALKQAYDYRDSPDTGKKRSVRGAISVVLMDIPALATAILEEKSDDAFNMCKEYVIADANLLAWIQIEGVADWINTYLTKEIAPVLDAMSEAEEDGPTTADEPADDAPDTKESA